MFDVQYGYRKLADQEALTEGEVHELLKEVQHWRQIASYLASCHAATAESLPKAASKASRRRHVAICKAAVVAMKDGVITWNGHGADSAKAVQYAADRCQKVLEEQDHVV